jgi:hypothetical protein
MILPQVSFRDISISVMNQDASGNYTPTNPPQEVIAPVHEMNENFYATLRL